MVGAAPESGMGLYRHCAVYDRRRLLAGVSFPPHYQLGLHAIAIFAGFFRLRFGRGVVGLGVGRVCRNHHAAQGNDHRLCAVVCVSHTLFGVWLG